MECDVKIRARRHANHLLRQGVIVRRFCESCGDMNAEMHHDDYRLMHRVRWLCKVCHEHLHTLADRFP